MTPEDPYYNRRVRGTVLHRYRNSVTLGILALSGLIGFAFHYLPHSQSLVEKIREGVFRNSEDVDSRRMLMQESLTRSSQALKRHKQHTEDMS